MDEFPEFQRKALEALREPLEEKKISICRSKYKVEYPADFILVAAMNPCPCGMHGSTQCVCNELDIKRYHTKLSGPLLDRIDLRVWVSSTSVEKLSESSCEKITNEMQVRVLKARELQKARYQGITRYNASLSIQESMRFAKFSESTKTFLFSSVDKLRLSTRAYLRVLRIARTIADLEQSEVVLKEHVAEAISYRMQGAIN